MATPNGSGLRVLWASDGSESAHSAIPLLRRLVLPATQHLVVLSVAPHSLLSGARPEPRLLAKVSPSLRRRALLDAEEEAQRSATELDPVDTVVAAVSRWGNPISEVLRQARLDSSDLIVLGAKGHSNLHLILLGSVSQSVVQHATRPVLIARSSASDLKEVIVGLDGSSHSRRAVDFLEALNPAPDIAVRLVFVIEPALLPDGLPRAYRREALENARHIDQQRLHAAREALNETAHKLAATGRHVETEVVSGQSGPVLDAVAARHGAALIVVGSRKPARERHYLLGSTAEKLVRHSHASVLVVR
jgi:nucleotide-binding universal stress UspA family protein